MKRRLTTNSRLVNELFANYISTFTAFCELINNSLQADSKNIRITFDYTKPSEVHPLFLKKVIIEDDGYGVHMSEIKDKLLEIGTPNKEGGKGIGRFAAFQIGKSVDIETIGFNEKTNKFSRVAIPLHVDMFGRNLNVSDVEVETNEEELKGKHKTYYKVTITDLYDTLVTNRYFTHTMPTISVIPCHFLMSF